MSKKNSKTNIRFTLDTRRPLRQGDYSVKLYLYHQQKATYINIGNFAATKGEWNDEEECYRRKAENSRRLNNQLNNIIDKAQQLIDELDYQGELKNLSLKMLKDEILSHLASGEDKYVYGVTSNSSRNRMTLLEYRDKLVELYDSNEQHSTADNYRYDLNPFFNFLETPEMKRETPRGRNTLMVEIKPNMLSRYRKYLEKKGRKNYGIYNPLKRLKGLYNNAVKNNDLEFQYNPFNQFVLNKPKSKNQRVKQQRTKQNRYLYFERIRELKLIPESELWHVRNYVLFMWNSMGMQFIDSCLLRVEDINWELKEFYYVRNKLKRYDRELIVPFTPESEQILNYYYNKRKKGQELIFPIFDIRIIKRGIKKEILTRYDWYRDQLNRGLKTLCELAELPEKITSYEIRRIWGEHAKEEGVDASIIKDSYGHQKQEMTDGYTRLHPVDVIANTNEMLVTGFVDIFNNIDVPEAKAQPKKAKPKKSPPSLPASADKLKQKSKKESSGSKEIGLDTQITIADETLSVEDYILELLPDYTDGDAIFINKLTMKIIATTELKNARQVKGLIEEFLER